MELSILMYMKGVKMNYLQRVLAILAVVLLSGCAAKPIEITENYWTDSPQKTIAIAFVKPPAMGAHRSGAQGLLDMAINEAVTDTVQGHISTLNYDSFDKGSSYLVSHIEEKGALAFVLPDYYESDEGDKLPKDSVKEGFFEYDLAKFKELYSDATHLLVIQAKAAGTIRDYYGFIPLSSPRGYLYADVIMVDVSNNKIDLRQTIVEQVELTSNAAWDDPENGFPEISKIVEKALLNGRDRIIKLL